MSALVQQGLCLALCLRPQGATDEGSDTEEEQFSSKLSYMKGGCAALDESLTATTDEVKDKGYDFGSEVEVTSVELVPAGQVDEVEIKAAAGLSIEPETDETDEVRDTGQALLSLLGAARQLIPRVVRLMQIRLRDAASTIEHEPC